MGVTAAALTGDRVRLRELRESDLGPPHQNRGLGTEATRLVLRFGFDELGLHRIQLTVNGFNERGLATYRKVGFVEEGRSREAIFRSGTWHDQVHMGILAREWRAAR